MSLTGKSLAAVGRAVQAPPGFPSHAFKPPKPKIAKPIWAMTDQELLAVARGQAEAAYKPQLDELHRLETDQTQTYQAAQAGLAKLLEALQSGTSGYADQIAKIFADAQNAVAGHESGYGTNTDVTQSMYQQEGDAYKGAGQAESQLIGNEGQMQYLTAVQDQNKALADIAREIASVSGKIPGATQEALSGLYKAREDYYKDNRPVLRTVGGSLYAVNPNDPTQMKLLKKAPGKPLRVNLPLSKALHKWVDAGGKDIPGITEPVPEDEPGAPKVNLGLSNKLKMWVDSGGHPVQGLPPYPKDKKDRSGWYALTVGQQNTLRQKGQKLIAQSLVPQWHVLGDPSKPLTSADLKRMVDAFNKKQIAAGVMTTKNKKTVPWKDNPITVAELSHLAPNDLADMGLAYEVHPGSNNPQEVYLAIAQSGVPAQLAWKWVRKAYPNWGEGYFDPKGKAPNGAVAFRGDYAIPAPGKLIGTPYSGTHTLGNWESDNAVDVSMPVGTPIYATEDGVIGSRIGSLGSSNPRMAGLRLHLESADNEFYYQHLSRLVVRAGQRVKKGQLLGYSGSANGSPHLHFAMRSGTPMSIYGSTSA